MGCYPHNLNNSKKYVALDSAKAFVAGTLDKAKDVISKASKKLKNESETEKTRGSFEQYLLNAVSSVNDKQMNSDAIAQQLITDPDSVDVHDVTIAMAEASLSLSLAQTVIDRVIKDWNEITTTR